MDAEQVGFRYSSTYIRIPRTVIEAKISPASKIVYGAMLGLQGKREHVFASQGRIAAVAGTSRTTVKHAIAELTGAGLIVMHIKDDGKPDKRCGGFKGTGLTNVYTCRFLIGKKANIVRINEVSA